MKHIAAIVALLVLKAVLLTAVLAPTPARAAERSSAAAEPAQGREILAPGTVLPQRNRPAVVNSMLEERLTDLLPRLMRETGIDLWLVINREYAEDPVYLTLVPEPVFAARRTTMLVFHDRGADEGLERFTVSRYAIGDLYATSWEGGDLEEQWQRLGEILQERQPRKIGINTSRHWPVADGLTAGLHERLMEVLTPELRERVVSAEDLVVRWLETRTEREVETWSHVVSLARGVISEAFSERVVTPGVTTTDDIAWYIRQRFADLGLRIWFMPSVNRQYPGATCAPETDFCGDSGVVRRGDVLHTDVGICYLRLCTDTQEMAYVAQLDEDAPPAPLVEALRVGNRWQDLLTHSFQQGRSGNQILATARDAAEAEGIQGTVYTHPLGFYGHAPGPTIGMWDNQGPTPHRGDWPLHPMTGYAIEGNVKVQAPSWTGNSEQWVQIKLEQGAVYDGEQVLYLAGRQTRWHVIR